ncbi:MAG: putative 2-dehydropantoate 2-reductase [Thiopseudomonas sp.]|nr:putative 2-dehydropantoate 2-reductase [Thiopseudomonas sp.]
MQQIAKHPPVGIIGTGAIAGYYGLMLARAGVSVRFLARSDHDVLAAQGLQLNSSTLGELRQPVDLCSDMGGLAGCDWILVATKTTANADVAQLLAQLPNPVVNVVLLQNGFAVEDELRPLLPARMRLFAGLCFIYARRTAPGQISHQGGGSIHIGYHSGALNTEQGEALAAQLVQLFNDAGVSAQQAAVLKARWQKLVWNVPYNGLSVVLNATTQQMMEHSPTQALIRDLMQEVVDAATACGCPLSDKLVPSMLDTTSKMGDYHPSMYADFAAAKPLELQAIYRAPLAAATQVGHCMPKTRMLLQQLEFIADRIKAGGAA